MEQQTLVTSTEAEDHGITFLNTDWNDSISNGKSFTLRWNQTLNGPDVSLGVFKVHYPVDGRILYQFEQNLTDSVAGQHYEWTPENLDDGLYALRLATGTGTEHNWTVSPPWKIQEKETHHFHWTEPVGIPIAVMLCIYIVVLVCCVYHRRRKNALALSLQQSTHACHHNDAQGLLDGSDSRQASVSSVFTAKTLVEPEGISQPGMVLFAHNKLSANQLSGDGHGPRKDSSASAAPDSSTPSPTSSQRPSIRTAEIRWVVHDESASRRPSQATTECCCACGGGSSSAQGSRAASSDVGRGRQGSASLWSGLESPRGTRGFPRDRTG